MKQYAFAYTTNPNVSLLETLNFHCVMLSLFLQFHAEPLNISAIRRNCFLTVGAAVDTSRTGKKPRQTCSYRPMKINHDPV